jgi:MoaA/NifB/PqqE/SkfB family radical SAM enzyme
VKPLAYDKILKYKEKLARGESCAIVEIEYDYICNLHCKHCLAARRTKKIRKLSPADVHDIALQADALGLAQFIISGGEPLMFKDLEQIFEAIMPERFQISLSTNGLLLTHDKAVWLKRLGLDKIKISVDSIDELAHNNNRGNDSSFSKAMAALNIADEVGFQTIIQHVVTHQNAQSQELIELCEFSKKRNMQIDVMIAKPLGEWEGREDILLDDSDTKYLRDLYNKYPLFKRDVFPHYGSEKDQGCNSVRHILGITTYGDVLGCPFVNISIGNIFEETLESIIQRGMNIKHFRYPHIKCLSGEDRMFIDKYMNACIGKSDPADYREIFTENDFIDVEKYRR